MNLRDLQYFVAVVDTQHFAKAAKQCHVSQPTLSMQIKKLEAFLGVALFERTNKRVMTTATGQVLAQHAREVLRGVAQMREVAKNTQNPLAGEFRLGAFPTLAPYFLPLVTPAIGKQLPQLKLLLIEEKTAHLLAMLKDGALDAALIALPVLQEGLESAPLFDDPFLLAVPQGHRLAKRASITQKEISGEALLLLEDGHCLREQALEVCSIMNLSEKQDFRATSLETLRQMVAAGVGITLIPKLAQRQRDGLVYIPFSDRPLSRQIGLVWRKTSARRACVATIRKLMADKN